MKVIWLAGFLAVALIPGAGLEAQPVSSLQASGSCTPTSERLCLFGGKIGMSAIWRTAFPVSVEGTTGLVTQGRGRVVPPTPGLEGGLFWFFSSKNPELFVKVVDGCALNGRYWVFAAGLTNVNFDITFAFYPTSTGIVYSNPQGRLGFNLADTDAIPCPPSAREEP
jgi:hypothetical protein